MSSSPFHYQENHLFAEDVPLQELAQKFGTPLYVYSRHAIEAQYKAYVEGLGDHPGMICYAVKANSNLGVLSVLARLGAGFDIVSVGELERVLLAGGLPEKIIFSGIGKTAQEMRRALEVGIHCFNVESDSELELLNRVAGELGVQAPISIRVNPDVDALTHPYISTGLKQNKFGIDHRQAVAVYQRAASLPNISIHGIDCHIGSQLLTLQPFSDALDRVLALVDELADLGIGISHIDMGGGIGVKYAEDDSEPEVTSYIRELATHLQARQLSLILEPGRSIVANAGLLLTEVQYLKDNGEHHFGIIDAGMNDLIRPALYQAWMDILPAEQHQEGVQAAWDIVGPICETGDFLGKARDLNLKPGDLLAVAGAGAYSFVMASNYNSRPKPAEVLVYGDQVTMVRQRETLSDLWANESIVEE